MSTLITVNMGREDWAQVTNALDFRAMICSRLGLDEADDLIQLTDSINQTVDAQVKSTEIPVDRCVECQAPVAGKFARYCEDGSVRCMYHYRNWVAAIEHERETSQARRPAEGEARMSNETFDINDLFTNIEARTDYMHPEVQYRTYRGIADYATAIANSLWYKLQ